MGKEPAKELSFSGALKDLVNIQSFSDNRFPDNESGLLSFKFMIIPS